MNVPYASPWLGPVLCKMREEMTMDNPFRDGGPLDQVTPWITALLAVVLAVAAVASDVGPIIKAIAVLASTSVIARAAYLIVRRRHTSH
ncbi:hypothetical protein EV578_10124 [Streptomyces sp. BK205]|nr:hypothetical protein EV578_10124 [Streptomyces sp. BK205]